MFPRTITGVVFLVLNCVLLVPAASAQQASGIAGLVEQTIERGGRRRA